MSPTLSLLVGLTAFISQAFSLTVPAQPAVGLTNGISVDTPVNPLPPSPGGWYKIPGTSLAIRTLPPYGAPINPPTDASSCLTAAQAAIANHIATSGDGPIPQPTWSFTAHNVALVATGPYPNLGTYGKLAAALQGVLHFLTAAGGPGARAFDWALGDDLHGVVIIGSIGPAATRVGDMLASAAAGLTASATPSIVGVKELVTG